MDILWKAILSDNTEFYSNSIFDCIGNPRSVSPWIRLEEYCIETGLRVTYLCLLDESLRPIISSPRGLVSKNPDFIDFRMKSRTNQLATHTGSLCYGIIMKYNGISFGVWVDSTDGDIYTTVE